MLVSMSAWPAKPWSALGVAMRRRAPMEVSLHRALRPWQWRNSGETYLTSARMSRRSALLAGIFLRCHLANSPALGYCSFMHRRAFLTGLAAGLVAAPSVVSASSLMPLRGKRLLLPRSIFGQFRIHSISIMKDGSGLYEGIRAMEPLQTFGPDDEPRMIHATWTTTFVDFDLLGQILEPPEDAAAIKVEALDPFYR